ncbi:MAG: AIR synthase-related protein, partial [Candidatus Aminicenantes bacterium]|nr:AIR synthase-related protein [Candidatus Aminicenantes bacterium]
EESHIRECLASHLSPEPRVELGRAIASHRLASSMIDISDGLSRDLMNICRESRKGAQLLKHRIPISEAVLHLAAEAGEDPYQFALHGGEDYELLFTVTSDKLSKMEKLIEKGLPTPVTMIGSITRQEQGITMVDQQGNRQPLLLGGYEHFVPHKI